MRRLLIALLAVVLLTGLTVLVLYARDMAAARARLKGHSQSVETPYGRLEYATMGQGPDVLVIHGAAGGFDQGLDMTGPLSPHGYRLIAPSRFGYLGSAMPLMPGAMSRMMLGTDAKVVAAASPSEKARVQQILDHLLPTGPRRRGMDFDVATAADHATVYDLSAIRCPVLAVSDEDDAFGTAARARFIVARVKQGRVVTYPTGGHALVGRQDQAMAEVVGFLLAHSAAINRH